MGTPDITFDSLSDRRARNALFATSVVIFITAMNLSALISPAVMGQVLPFVTWIEIIVVFGQILTALSCWSLISKGNTELGGLRLAYSFAVLSLFRVLVRDSLGLPLGVMTAIVVSAIGYLALSSNQDWRATLLGYGAGGAIIIVDLFAGNFYARQQTPELLFIAARNLAIFVFLLQWLVLFTQARWISFASKIANYFALSTLVAVMLVGYLSIQVLREHVASGQDVTGFVSLALRAQQHRMILTGAAISLFGAGLGVLIARTLGNPIHRLSETARQLQAGNLQARALDFAEDEIGSLATAFNHMAESLEGLFGQLESRVEARTRDLKRRAVETQAAAEIGRAATTVRDLGSLLDRTVYLITERFGFYHAGIFLVEPAGEYAVLQAASSEGGERMLKRGHRLRVGETGIVGIVTQTGRARIALNVGQDAVYFDNPELPNTRSEMALPLLVGHQILGALDVQSTEANAFEEQDITTLQILADQLAIAIQNAQLFKEAQDALEAARLAYGDMSRKAWGRVMKSQPRISYVATAPGSIRANSAAPSTDVMRTVETGDVILSSDGHTIGIPIKIRGQTIGALRLKKQDTSSSWTQDEINLSIGLSEQLSGALESARLYRESQQRAARESLVSDISARITSLPRVDTILRETVQELGETFGNAEVTFQLVELPDEREQVEHPGNGSGPNSLQTGKDEE